MSIRAPFAATLLAALLAGALSAGADEESASCDSTDGWALLDVTGGVGKPVLSVGEPHEGAGSVQLAFERTPGATALVRPCLLVGLRRLEFSAWGAKETPLLITAEDRDGARFHVVRPLPAGEWTRVSVTPADFELAPDSPVKKPGMDPDRLGLGFGLLDAGGVLGKTGANTLRIDALRIEREELPAVSLPAAIEGTVEIKTPGRHEGDVVVRKGGTLRILASRFVLAGGVTLEGGTLELVGGAFTLEAAYSHQRKIDLGAGSRVVVRDCVLANSFLPSFEVREGASLEFDGMTPLGVGTSTSVTGGTVTVRKARWPGEFMIFPKSTVVVEDTATALLWVMLGENAKGTLRLPDGKRIEDWSLDAAMGISLVVRRCDDIRWGLITAPGADVTVENTHYTAAGITLWGETTLEGIRNGDTATGSRLTLKDRRVELKDTTVDVWNVYAGPGAKVTLKGCRLGECWSFGDSSLTLIDSECDGTGGYVTSLHGSTFRLVNCTLDTEVIAQDQSTMTLERCRVKRAVSASGKALLKLEKTPVPGGVKRIGEARVEGE